MLKFSGHGGVAGKIKVNSKVPLWKQKSEQNPVSNLNESFLDLSKAAYDASHSMKEFHNAPLKASYVLEDYVIRIYNLDMNEAALAFRIADKKWISFCRNVKAFYEPMKDTQDFTLRFIHDGKNSKVTITVTSQVLQMSNHKHLKLMIIQNMANKIAEVTNWDDDELRVLIENLCIFPHLPNSEFNGVLYDSHSGKSYVKNVILPEPNEEYLNKFKAKFNNGGTINVSNSISEISKNLPGVMQTRLDCPHCNIKGYLLWNLVQHLNDKAEWSREKIADWLDELADDGRINIDFAPWENDSEKPNYNPKLYSGLPDEDAEEIVAKAMIKLTPKKAAVIADMFKELLSPGLEKSQAEFLIGNINILLGEAYANKN